MFPMEFVSGQSLTSTSASFAEPTAYPVFNGKDFIYYFCGTEGHQNGSLTASSSGGTVTFSWEKYSAGSFSYYSNETGSTSSLTGLGDGCYRVSFTDNGVIVQFRAWVINGWIAAASSIINSNCQSFNLQGSASGATYSYADLSTNQLITLNPGYKYIWTSNNLPVSTLQNPIIYQPPTKNTIYQLQVTDRAGCTESSQVTYQSIVAKANFTWTTTQPGETNYTLPEAPLTVNFVNSSENADPDKYEWFFFKDHAIIVKEGAGGAKVDSIMAQSTTANPAYTYESSGSYMVKLVAVKQTTGYTCRDTFYLKDPIVIDTSLVKVAPAFTPNGDGINDVLTIKTRSLESLDFIVFNRWGRMVHHYNKNGFIPEDSVLAAWDGKINGKLASPGVYFYVVNALGRDGKRRRKKGFTELVYYAIAGTQHFASLLLSI